MRVKNPAPKKNTRGVEMCPVGVVKGPLPLIRKGRTTCAEKKEKTPGGYTRKDTEAERLRDDYRRVRALEELAAAEVRKQRGRADDIVARLLRLSASDICLSSDSKTV